MLIYRCFDYIKYNLKPVNRYVAVDIELDRYWSIYQGKFQNVKVNARSKVGISEFRDGGAKFPGVVNRLRSHKFVKNDEQKNLQRFVHEKYSRRVSKMKLVYKNVDKEGQG